MEKETSIFHFILSVLLILTICLLSPFLLALHLHLKISHCYSSFQSPLQLIAALFKISHAPRHNILLLPKSFPPNLLTYSTTLCQRRGVISICLSKYNGFLFLAGPVKCSKNKSPPKSRNGESKFRI